jgi:hypothetical protein
MTSILPPPDHDAALATAGVLCHFVASDPVVTETFRGWVEHHPGDLTGEQVVGYLVAVHDLLAPTCEIPASTDLKPERRLRVVGEPGEVADARAMREHMRRWRAGGDTHRGEDQ